MGMLHVRATRGGMKLNQLSKAAVKEMRVHHRPPDHVEITHREEMSLWPKKETIMSMTQDPHLHYP